MEQILQNSSSKLINFNVPNYLITNFDNLVKFKQMSRTSVLIQLMDSFIRNERKQIEEDGNLNELIVDVQRRNQKTYKKELVKIKEGVNSDFDDPINIPNLNPNNQTSHWSVVGDQSWEDSY